MKLFSAQSIDRSARSPVTAGLEAAAVALALFMALVSCVSDPPATPEVVPQSAPQAAGLPVPPVSQSIREVPSIISSMRVPEPAPHVVIATLAEPGLPPPPVLPPVIPTEITVLSAMPASSAAVVPAALPEPAVPAPAPVLETPAKLVVAPVAKSALPEPKTAIPAKPATVAPMVKPAAKPDVKPVAATTPAKTMTPKPADPGTVPAVVPAVPAVVLPATPPSQARSVDAARTQPVAETRIETVRGERFELRFPGTGWIYLGDEDGKEGLRYETRRFEATQAVFAMNPDAVGEYLLRFQRQNPVDQVTETSLVRVVVTDRTGFTAASSAQAAGTPVAAATAGAAATGAAADTVAAAKPGPAAVPAGSSASAAAPSTAATTVTPVAASTEPAALADPASLIKLAKTELEAKRTQAAIEALDRYLTLFPYGNDELFYLYGLAYEQDTPFRDIKKSWDYYRRVRDEYPRSARWTAAADRIAYLEKHYFGLR